jgi:hypothetical protein
LIEALAPSAPPPAVIEVKPGGQSSATAAEPTPEQTVIIADLHWLVHQGNVLEFADGRLETAKKPLPRPQTRATPEASPRQEPEKKSAEEKSVVGGETAPATETALQPEAVVEPAIEISTPTAVEAVATVESAPDVPVPTETEAPVQEPNTPAENPLPS